MASGILIYWFLHVVEAEPGWAFLQDPRDVVAVELPEMERPYLSSEYLGGVQPMAQLPTSLLTQTV